MKNKYLLSAILFLLFVSVSKGQDSTASNAKFSIYFENNSVYAGRKDSLTTPYLTPSIGYFHKSGFYASADASFLMRTGASRLDLTSVSAGYNHSFGNFTANLSGRKYFYNNSSTNVKAEVTNEIDLSLTYEINNFSIWVEPGVYPGKNTDYYFISGIGKDFLIGEHFDLFANYSFNAQTRNFYSDYYAKRRLRTRNGMIPVTVTAVVTDSDKMQVLSSDFSFPLTYTKNNWSFSFTPTYSIASNPAVLNLTFQPTIGPTIYKTIQEKISNTWWFSLEASFKL